MKILTGALIAALLLIGFEFHMRKVEADEAGNHRVYLTGYNDFKNEDTTVEIFRDSKTSTEFVCFSHKLGPNDTFSCVQLDPSKVTKP